MEAFNFGEVMPAHWAIFRHDPRAFGTIAATYDRASDFWNNISCFMQTNDIADEQSLFFHEVLIIECRALY